MSPIYASVSVAAQKAFHNPYLVAVGIGIAIGFFPIACELVIMSSLPGKISGWVSLLWIFVWFILFMVTLVGLVPALTLMLFRGARRTGGLIWIACVCALLSTVPAAIASWDIRMNGFKQMAERTKPLVAAIKKYENQKGHALEQLEDLVPEFLPEVPKTGIGAYPDYHYERLEGETDPWELSVWCGVGISNWDEFFYRPSEKYGERAGGWVEPVGDWAYFHE